MYITIIQVINKTIIVRKVSAQKKNSLILFYNYNSLN